MKTTRLLLIALVLSATAATSPRWRKLLRGTTGRTRDPRLTTRGPWRQITGEIIVTDIIGIIGIGHARTSISASGLAIRTTVTATPITDRILTVTAIRPPACGDFDGYTDDATVAAVQRRLARGGYYRGAIDGVIGQGTRSAIRAYERNNGLRVDGRIDRQLLATMGLA